MPAAICRACSKSSWGLEPKLFTKRLKTSAISANGSPSPSAGPLVLTHSIVGALRSSRRSPFSPMRHPDGRAMDTVIVQGRESGLGQRIAARLELDPGVGSVVGGLDRPGLVVDGATDGHP